MKARLHFPTEQYGFSEVDVEVESPLHSLNVYDETKRLYQNTGLPDKEYNGFIERQLTSEANHIEDYEKMSPDQQRTVQVIKRALKRLEAKEDKPTV